MHNVGTRLTWEHTHRGMAAVYDTRVYSGQSGTQVQGQIFARVLPQDCGAWYKVVTNDWSRTDMRAETEAQAKQMVEAIWALENH